MDDSTNTPLKHCNKCQQSFSVTTEYFYSDPYKKDGLRTVCKNCTKAAAAKRHVEVAEGDHKKCTKCGTEYPATTDHFHSRGRLGLSPQCKECRQAARRKYPKRILAPVLDGYKRCTKCEEAYPATTEYFYTHRKTLKPTCKKCSNIPSHHTPEPIEVESKICPRCARAYSSPLSLHFQRDVRSKDGWLYICKLCCQERKQTHYALHGDKVKARKKAEYAANPEKFRTRKRAERAAHPEWQREQNRKYTIKRKNDPVVWARWRTYSRGYQSRYYTLNKEWIAHRSRLYRQAHPEKVREQSRYSSNRRRARKRNNGGTYRPQDIRDQFKRQRGRCYYCQSKLRQYHIDHVVPVSRGGTNDISNIVLACPTCNLKKHDKLPHEWPEGNRLL